MSMIGNLARIPEATRQKLHEHPEHVESFLYPELATTTAHAGSGFLGHLFNKRSVGSQSTSEIATEHLPESDHIDLDKAWHGLHYVFTGSNWEGEFPQGFLVSCGEPIGDVDVGYGPARSFTPEEVIKIAAFLETIDDKTISQRFDPKRMAELEIYPCYAGLKPEEVDVDDECDYLVDTLQTMKQFVREAAKNRMALLVYIN